MNMHIHNSKGDLNSIIKKFMSNFNKLTDDEKNQLDGFINSTITRHDFN